MAERLADADIDISSEELQATVTRLEDCGRVARIQRAPGTPIYLVPGGYHQIDLADETAELMADICAVLRTHDEQFTDVEELKQSLSEVGADGFDDRQLNLAVNQLFNLQRLKTPRVEQWADVKDGGERPTWFFPPKPHQGNTPWL